jgi:hypothetical protein
MCKHVWKTINNVRVCPRCGLTVLNNGRIMLDKKLPGILSRKGKGIK